MYFLGLVMTAESVMSKQELSCRQNSPIAGVWFLLVFNKLYYVLSACITFISFVTWIRVTLLKNFVQGMFLGIF